MLDSNTEHYVQSMLLNISQDGMKHGASLTSNIFAYIQKQ